MEPEKVQYIDAEEYHQKDEGIDIRDITLRRFISCTNEGAKEMTRGGLIKRLVDNKVVEIAVPDQIQIFINNVKMLRIILQPEIEKNWTFMQEKIESFEKSKQLLDKYYQEAISEIPKNIKIPRYLEKHKRDQEQRDQQIRMKNQITEEYDSRLSQLYLNLLEAFSHLLSHLNYFKTGFIEDR